MSIATSKKTKQKAVPDLNLTQSTVSTVSKEKKSKESKKPSAKERSRKFKDDALTTCEKKKEASRAQETTTEPKLRAEKKKKTPDSGTDVMKPRRGYGSMPTASWNKDELAAVQREIRAEKKTNAAKSNQAGDIAGHSAPTPGASQASTNQASTKPAPIRSLPPLPYGNSMPTLLVSARNFELQEGLNQTRQQAKPTALPPLPPPRRTPITPTGTELLSEQSKSPTQSSDTSPSQSADASPRTDEVQSLRLRATSVKPMKTPQVRPTSPRTLKKSARQVSDPQNREQPPSILPSVGSGTAQSQKGSSTTTVSFDDLFELMNDIDSLPSIADITANSSQQQVANIASGDAKKETLAKAYFEKLMKDHRRVLFEHNIHEPMQAVSNALPSDMLMTDVKTSPDALLNAVRRASIGEAKQVDFIAKAIELAATENPFGSTQAASVLHLLVVRTGNIWALQLAESHAKLHDEHAAIAKSHAEKAHAFADLHKKLS